MIYSKALDQSFESKEALFDALKGNSSMLISKKKAQIKCMYKEEGDFMHAPLSPAFLPKLSGQESKALPMKDGFIYPIGNTVGIYDSHEDVHLLGSWNKTAKEQNGKIMYLIDHKVETDKVAAFANDVKLAVTSVPWSLLNYYKEGETEVLYLEIPKNRIKADLAKRAIDEKWPMQNSVRLRYIDIVLAMDSDREEDKEYNANWNMYIGQVANKEDIQNGYFFAVKQAQLVIEVSMVVMGSNPVTPIKNNNEPEEATHLDKPEKSTLLEALEGLENQIKLNHILNNLQK